MLAYRSNRPPVAGRGPYPHAMLVIVGAHVAALAVLMSARMEFEEQIKDPPTIVDIIREDDPPPPDPQTEPRTTPAPEPSLTLPPPLLPLPPTQVVPVEPAPLPDLGQIVKPFVEPGPVIEPTRPPPEPVRVAAQLATPASRLKPDYPASKLASGEEAVLRLRLSIDERGRVVAVEPAGPADGAFLAAARRHLIAYWRYKPATEGGKAIASSAVITLRFELEG